MTSAEIDNLLKGFPRGRICTSREANGEIQGITFYNCLGNSPPLDPFFKALRETSITKNIKTMKFYSDGDDYETASQIDPREAVNLLVRYGPFVKLNELSIGGDDYIARHPVGDLSTLQKAAPALRYLSLTSCRGVGLENPLELRELHHLVLRDIAFDQLEMLSKCSLPELEVLEISFYKKDSQIGLEQKSLDSFCRGSFSKKLKKLSLTASSLCMERKRELIFYFTEIFPGSPLLDRLSFLDLIDFHFSNEELERLRQKKSGFSHLEKFYLGGDFNTWPEMEKRVGDFVSTPRKIRERELSDLSVFPTDAEEVRIQIGKIIRNVNVHNVSGSDEIRFVVGVASKCLTKTEIQSCAAVFDSKNQEVIETAQAIRKIQLDVPEELRFYRQIPSILQALKQLKIGANILICDGAIEKTPYEFGLANYLGLKLDMPALGCVDEISFGEFEPPTNEPGAATEVVSGGGDSNHCIAICLRTKKNEQPVFISAGHKISINMARNLVLQLSHRHRLPEPFRVARQVTE